MPPFLTSLAAKLAGVAIIALLAAAGAGWTVHKVDDDSYKALQLADANALNLQMIKDAAALMLFNERQADAANKTNTLLASLKGQREDQSRQLTATLNLEGMKDASLAQCLALKLPDDVLRQLAP